jgi:hypothetical protein
MVALVERMLELNKRRGGLGPPAAQSQTGAQRAPLPPEAEHLEREVAATDAQIDSWFTTCPPGAATVVNVPQQFHRFDIEMICLIHDDQEVPRFEPPHQTLSQRRSRKIFTNL